MKNHQSGGSLPILSDLAVPASLTGLTMISHWLADAKDSKTKNQLMETLNATLATFNPYAGEAEAERSSRMTGRKQNGRKPKRSQTSQDGGMGGVGQLVLRCV